MSLFDRLVVTTLPVVPKYIVGKVASRYVAGESFQQAVDTVKSLNAEGASCTLDLLGEEIAHLSKADEATETYCKIIDGIHQYGLNCNISTKPSQLGLALDEQACRTNYDRLMEKAAERQCFVRLDMEDRHTTDPTLRTYRYLHEKYGAVGPVFQAYMRRTLRDIAELPAEQANVRLCKGIYIEPRAAAWKGHDTVRRNFVAALEKLLRQDVFVGIATHDEYLVCEAVALIDRLGIARERYEFQMLLGVDAELRRILIEEGHPLRVYVPYGSDWYLYSMRRLRENPQVAGHVMRAMLSGR
ncbi:MAG: proline dehydrogenase family protein [Acidobacteriota bacterium]